MATKTKAAEPEFLAIPVKRLFLLTFFTFGFYELFWFYRNWKAIENADKTKLHSIFRAIFSIFFVAQLFKRMFESAAKTGFKAKYNHVHLAAVYIASSLALGVLGRISNLPSSLAFIGVMLISLVPILYAQQAANAHAAKTFPKAIARKTSAGERVIIVVGVIIFLLALAGMFIPEDYGTLNTDQQSKLDTLNSLTTQYENCSDDLIAREETLDESNEAALDAYDKDWDACEGVRLKQNEAVDAYNKSIGL